MGTSMSDRIPLPDLFFCIDPWCDGHARSNERCTEPLDNTDDDDEEKCP